MNKTQSFPEATHSIVTVIRVNILYIVPIGAAIYVFVLWDELIQSFKW
jgi:hypothetical protein